MKLPALALNLLISERVDQRLRFAENMKEIIESEFDLSALGRIFKTRLILNIDRCVENPNCPSRTILFSLADFWNSYFKTKVENSVAA